jgi:hypothetical protein
MSELLINVTIPVKLERVHDAIVGAFEGGSNYWLSCAEFVTGTRHATPQLVWYGESSVFETPFSFDATHDPAEGDDDSQVVTTITNADIEAGLQIMATQYASHFADLINETDDASTHDVFMQCVILKSVVFG